MIKNLQSVLVIDSTGSPSRADIRERDKSDKSDTTICIDNVIIYGI